MAILDFVRKILIASDGSQGEFSRHRFICRLSDSAVSEDARIEQRTVATLALTVRRPYHSAIDLIQVMVDLMGRRPLPAVRDLTRDGRWSTYDVSVLKKMGGGGEMITDRTPSNATITNKTLPAGSFSSS